jgi:hypothetical protein
MTRIRNRAALAAVLLALGVLTVGAGSASANSSMWGDNGSGTCAEIEEYFTQSQSGVELGTYCMQSVTGWIQINEAATQRQAISCANNDSSSGLSYSTDGQAYDNAGPWYSVGSGGGWNFSTLEPETFVGWQTGDGGDADLSMGIWYGGVTVGSNSSAQYGSAGATVTNFGGSGHWQTALACANSAGASAVASVKAARVRVHIRDRTIDSVNKKKGKAFLAREYVVKKNVTRTDTRTCPAGMVRKGKLSYTVQEFPADNKSPKWKDRSLVDVKLTAKGKNAGSVTMTLTRAKNPTVVQFQLRCVKG